ncbi:hypothetical protein JKF63_03244 [Porcisia hertigi]|uniref:Carbohydrate-binding/sugar hydrolysis domain-containing protein n=1 Tax=Porcisia hertigi TaxID=2761500 RepID=A0A836IMV6_9TRYP|nr:hypothetical protein JKF63_03244 [Porcisia hertigi]
MYEEAGFVVVQRYSQWQKKKVRTIVVNAYAKNPSQKSIAEAIAMARPYDRIELTGGEFHESFAIQMPLELVAAEGEEPRINSRASTITIATSGIDVYLERIVVSTRSNSKLDTALLAVAGSPTCYRCLFSSVLIGGSAVATLDECTVEESWCGVGIIVQDSGGGTIKSSTIRNHRNLCADIDTRGELMVTDCTIDNATGGDGISISAATSSISRDSSAPYTSCSHVQVEHCRFSISEDGSRSTSSNGPAGGAGGAATGGCTNIAMSACCIVLSQWAAPTIAMNEFLEGEIGVLIEGPSTAKLKGNTIRLQRRCGILAIVEEGFGYSQDHKTLRITGDNLLDRCHVGIDVQCATNRASFFQQQGSTMTATGAATGAGTPADAGVNPATNSYTVSNIERFISDELPNPKRAFSWTPVQGSTPPPCSRDAACFPPSTLPTTPHLVCMEGKWYTLDKLKSNIQQLVTMALQAYPTCLQPSFEVATGGAAMSMKSTLSMTSANPFTELLRDTLGTQLNPLKDARSVESEMLHLRGNKGVDIINTKFSNCDVCAIRFGRQGYGLVEDCVFEDCGTFAIIVDCSAHPLITGCHFLRSRGASILVANFANPLIIGNEITSGKRNGIHLTNMSRGVIAGNIITAHVGVGVHMDKHSDPLICANLISQNRKGGISVADGSKPTIIFNSFTANLHAQLSCTGSSDAFITHNGITSSSGTGIHIASCSRCTVLSNTVSANDYGFLVELDADPYVQDNDVTANTRAGVCACDNALGVFVGNRILKNSGPNVLVMEGASSVFRANRIEGSSQGGVVVCNEGNGFFERNTIATNAVANVLVTGAHAQPEFLRNLIAASHSGCGIVCARSSGGSFLRNTIRGNSQCGVFIREGSNPTFRDNTISREVVGVLVSDGGKGMLMHNVIQDCYGTGVLAQRQADPVFSDNKVTGCHMSGLQITPDSVGLFEKNELRQNDIGVHLGSSTGVAVIEVDSAYRDGVDVDSEDAPQTMRTSTSQADMSRSTLPRATRDKSRLRSIADTSEQRQASMARSAVSVIRDNIITKNHRGGVLLDTLPNATLEQNDIFKNNAYGVRGDTTYSAARAQALLKTDFVAGSNASVIKPLLVTQPEYSFGKLQSVMLIRANTIHDHDEANVFLDHFDGDKNETTITQNTIFNAPYGVCVMHDSTLHSMSKNEIHTCADGFGFASGGHGCYTANHVHHCTYSGIYVSDMAHPNFTDANRIENCGFSGVLVDVSGRGVFSHSTIRHCTNGVVVFCGPTSPFHISYEEMINARILTSTPVFKENTIEENELHGVLLLSVISGCTLRSPLILTGCDSNKGFAEASFVDSLAEEPLHDPPAPFLGALGATVAARGDKLCASFTKNVIRRNRVMGVYHDRFDHWDFSALDKAHAEMKPSTDKLVKNAYGGYEILLGTSQILDNDEHRRQRQLKQVSLVENVITECSIGFGAGYGCHPYLERNKIHHNTFFGLLLRFGSAVSAYGNDICENGVAGVYAANGAKGYIAKGNIESNNGWCRPENSQHTPRSFQDCIFSKSFLSQSVVRPAEEPVDTAAAAETKPISACHRAYEQMTRLTEVHAFTMTDALRYLAELVAASSAGLTLASGSTPSALVDLKEGASSLSTGETAASSKRLLGGLALPEYADVSTADGGIGVWVEVGSRVTIQANRIRKHRNSGVLITKGVLRHHSLLHKWFDMGTDSTVNTKGNVTTATPGTAKPTPEASSSATVDIFAVQREAPPLASEEPGVLFTPQMLCANGIWAAFQIAASTSFESLETSYASLLHHSLSSASPSCPRAEEKKHRADTSNHAHIADNEIRENTDGVHVEVFHALQACSMSIQAAGSASSANGTSPYLNGENMNKSGSLSLAWKDVHARSSLSKENMLALFPAHTTPANDAFQAAAAATSYTVLSHDTNAIDCEYNPLDFTIVVERNTVMQNRRHGVYAVHVADVNCGTWVSSRSALNEMIATPYKDIRTSVIVGKDLTQMTGTLSFGVYVLKQKVGHALFQKNDLFCNGETQVYVTSRYVAVTSDGDRTLMQLDTCASSLESSYASEVLIAVPVVASLLQQPPPGVLLWDENKIHDSKKGVRLCGYLGPHCVRFQRNTFANIEDEALLLEGHLAYVTIGKGNLFDSNGVGIRVSQEPRLSLATSPATCLTTLRTCIFHNTFRAAKDSSILLEATTERTPLVYRNEFSGHMEGGTALYAASDSSGSGADVQGNVFSGNYIPVVLVGKKGSGEVHTRSNPLVTLLENRFTFNYVGVVVCNGAFPKFERNLFDNNTRAGLEVVGKGTGALVHHCVFCEQRRDSHAEKSSATLAGHPPPPPRPTATETRSPAHSPKETILLKRRKLSFSLLPENARVLGVTSQDRLPAGLRFGPFTETVVDACGFVNNDIGVDAIRDATSAVGVLTEPKTHLKDCLFAKHQVCGVLVRGSKGAAWNSDGGLKKTVEARTASDAAAEVNSALSMAVTTVIEHCVFAESATADGCGDVVAMEGGCATFRNNVFSGTVVGKVGGLACFTQNNFVALSEVHDAPFSESALDLPGADNVAAPGVVIQEGGRIVVERNTIAHRKVGVQCLPGAEGIVTLNCVFQCLTGLLLAPFNRTDVKKNRVLDTVECGVLAYGGQMADNTIVRAAIGFFAQPASLYKGINAVPSHKRDALELLCARNTVIGCTEDGLLITTAGVFDGNTVSHCKNGIRITPSLKSGSTSISPVIKQCNVYDNSTGVCMDDDSESVVRDNDIFDNETIGLLVAPTATGTLQDNHISSPMDQGAVEIPTEVRLKSVGNIIRNQFSPAFQRGTRASRAKDYQVEQASLERELRDLNNAVEEAHQNMETVSGSMRSLHRELVNLYSRSIADFAAVMSGPAGRALRAASTETGKAKAAVGARKQEARTTSPMHAIVGTTSDVEKPVDVSGATAPRKRTSSTGPRATSANSRRASNISTGSRKPSKPEPTKGIRSRQKTVNSMSTSDPRQVLVHVFTNAETGGNADAIGQAITGILAKAPLSKYSFVPTISTCTSQLQQLLRPPHPMKPFLCVVVLDAHFGGLSHSDQHALYELHTIAAAAGGGGNDTSHRFYTVLPRSSSTKNEASGNEKGSMSFEAYAAAHQPLSYTTSVEEVLDDLHELIAKDLRACAAAETGKRAWRASLQGHRTSNVSKKSDDRLTSSDDKGSHRTSEVDEPLQRTPVNTKSPTFTTEHIGALFSQLTPEAFGFETAKGTRSTKKRKGSVSFSALKSDEDTQGRRKSSTQSRKNPTTGPAAPLSRRRSSASSSKNAQREPPASKKT